MMFNRTKTASGAVLGTLLLSLAASTAARSQPLPRFAQPDAQSSAALSRAVPFRTSRDVRSPMVEREHLRAQRIINRVCSGC